jgi:hypothetical protein
VRFAPGVSLLFWIEREERERERRETERERRETERE